jgi:hypothetical protein
LTLTYFGLGLYIDLHLTLPDLADSRGLLSRTVGECYLAHIKVYSLVKFIIISGSACSTGGVHKQAWSTSGIGLGSKSEVLMRASGVGRVPPGQQLGIPPGGESLNSPSEGFLWPGGCPIKISGDALL